MPSLDALAAEHDVRAVVTQPDRPAGRGLRVRATPVKARALEQGLHVLEPVRLDAAFVSGIARLEPQLLACVSYGKILPRSLLELPGMVALNVHPSLLPEYRGATPIQAALRDGRTLTGVTVIWMSPQMDAGDIALAETTAIEASETLGTLHDRLAEVGSRLLREAAAGVAGGSLPRTPQAHERATYTKPITKDELRIDQSRTGRAIVDLVRSASPSPGAWTTYEGKRLKVLEARAEASASAALTDDGPAIVAADGVVRLLRVVPEGKREMSGSAFAQLLRKQS